MDTGKTDLERTWAIVEKLSAAINLIKLHCETNNIQFDYDTEIPFGIGVDLHLLPSYRMVDETFPVLAKDEWYKERFAALKTIGDIVDMMRVILNEARDPSA